MDTISIIVPVYNVERYIDRCVNSIIRQTYSDLQIILVDDGSTDRTGAICDELALKDSRIEVIHKENGGAADARNAGLDRVRGAFIGFVDSDDYIDEDMYEVLYQTILRYDADMISCGYDERFADRTEIRCCSKETMVCNRSTAYTLLFTQKLGCSNCNKLFKSAILRNIRYKSGIQGEDLAFIYRVLDKVDKCVRVNEVKYHYMHRAGSVTTALFNIRQMDINYTMDEIVQFINSKYPQVSEAAYAYQLVWLISSKKGLMTLDKTMLADERNYIKRKIFGNFKYYWMNRYVSIDNKILLWSIIFHLFVPAQFFIKVSVAILHAIKRKFK